MPTFSRLPFLPFILGAASAAFAAAETSAPPLTLAQALARAGEQHPALAADSYAARAAAALVEQAGAPPAATLDLAVENAFGTGDLRGVRGLETTVQSSRTLEWGGKRGKRVALAEAEREIALRTAAVRRAEILAGTAAAFVQAVAAAERLALAGEPLRLARETLALAEARHRAGAAAPAETVRARVSLALAESETARLAAAAAAARTALAASWGDPAGAPPAVPGRLRLPAELPAVAAWRARLAGHPRLALQDALIAARRAHLALAQAQATGDVTATGGVRFLRAGSDAAFVAGLSFPLPSRERNQGNIRAARETLAGTESTVHAVQSELEAGFAAAWQDFAAAHALALKLARDAAPAAAEAAATLRAAYAAGQIPLTEVLEAQRALAAVRRELLEAEIAAALALARAESFADPAYPFTAALLSSA